MANLLILGGLRFLLVTQDFQQIKNKYKEEHEEEVEGYGDCEKNSQEKKSFLD